VSGIFRAPGEGFILPVPDPEPDPVVVGDPVVPVLPPRILPPPRVVPTPPSPPPPFRKDPPFIPAPFAPPDIPDPDRETGPDTGGSGGDFTDTTPFRGDVTLPNQGDFNIFELVPQRAQALADAERLRDLIAQQQERIRNADEFLDPQDIGVERPGAGDINLLEQARQEREREAERIRSSTVDPSIEEAPADTGRVPVLTPTQRGLQFIVPPPLRPRIREDIAERRLELETNIIAIQQRTGGSRKRAKAIARRKRKRARGRS